MATTELETMVVKLVGDAASYIKMMKDSQQESISTAKVVKESAAQIQSYGQTLEGFAGNALKALSVLGVATSLASAFTQFAKAEQTMMGLGVAFTAAGRDAETSIASFKKFAETLHQQTLVGKGAVLQMAKLGTSMGLNEDQTKQAIKTSIAIAAVKGGEAENYMRVAIGVQQGNIHMLKHALGMRGVTDEAQVLAKAQIVLTSGWAQANAMTETTQGQLKLLKASLVSVTIEMGKFVSDALKPFVVVANQAVNWYKSLDEGTRKWVVGLVTAAGAITAIQPMIAAFGPVIGAVKFGFSALKTTLTAVKVAMIALTSTPIGLAFLALAGVVALVVNQLGGLEATWELVKEAGGAAWEYVKEKASAFWEYIKPTVQLIGKHLSDLWDGVAEVAVDTWEYITEKVSDFVEWSTPVWQALGSAIKAVWDGAVTAVEYFSSLYMEHVGTVKGYITEAFGAIKEFIGGVWDWLTNKTVVDWTAVRDYIRDVILATEYVFRNFGGFAKLVWAETQLAFVKFYNEVEYFFVEVIPSIFTWFKGNWKDVWDTSLSYVSTVMGNLASNVYKVITSIPDLIRGKVTFSELWTPITEGFENTIKSLPNIPKRIEGDLEKALRESAEAQGKAYEEGWQEFRRKKLEEFGSPEAKSIEKAKEKVKEASKELFKPVIDKAAKAKHEVQKLTQALYGSAEAISRFAAYEASLMRNSGEVLPGGLAGFTGTSQRLNAGEVTVPSKVPETPKAKEAKPVDPAKEKANEFLERIAVATETTAEKDWPEEEDADL